MTGTLTAERKGETESLEVYGETSLEFTMSAIKEILDRAKGNDLWAKGYIVLEDSQGNILREMEAKD